MARARERVADLEEVEVGAVWAEIARAQDPGEIVFARIAAREYSISGECLVIQ